MLRGDLEREIFACSLTGASYEYIKNDVASLLLPASRSCAFQRCKIAFYDSRNYGFAGSVLTYIGQLNFPKDETYLFSRLTKTSKIVRA
jgi:hypothetical protein